MANNGIFYTSGNTLDFTTTGTTWARLSSGGTFSSLGLSATTYYNLPQSVSGAGTTNYISKWTGATGLGDSTIYDDGTFIGFNITSPTYGELVSIQTSNKGILIDDAYIIQTGNGSLAFATSNNYSSWGGSGEIAIGTRGTLINSIGSSNIGIGDKALNFNTAGNNNVAIGGTGSLLNNDNGNDNISIGLDSMNQNIDGSENVSIGNLSFYNNISGVQNVSIGQESGYNNNSDANVFIGRQSGYNHFGSNSIFIGERSDFPNSSQNYVLSVGNLIYGSISGKTVGINVTAQTNTLHVSASTNPVRFEGLQLSSNTRYLVADGNGVVTYRNLPGSSASDCFGTFYTSAISGCSPVTILTPLNATGGLNVTGTTNFTNTVDFSSGLTATTVSATTYQNLPTTNQYLIVAGTGSPEVPSSGQLILNPSEGEVFEIYISKTTYDGINNSSVIEGIKNSILVFNNSLFYSIYTLSFVSDFATYVRFGATLTGGDDYFTTNGQIVGATFISFGSVNTLTTVGTSGAATLVGNTLNIPQYGGGGGTFSGGTVTGPTNFTNGLSANTFSASTYQGNVVTQITAGTGISINQSTGNVTITSTGGGTSLGLVYTTGNNLNFI